jgi:hypothetical protein
MHFLQFAHHRDLLVDFWQALREELHYVNSLLKGHRELGLMVQKQLDDVLARQKSAK